MGGFEGERAEEDVSFWQRRVRGTWLIGECACVSAETAMSVVVVKVKVR